MSDLAPGMAVQSAGGGRAAVRAVGLGKNYGPVRALKSVDLTVQQGEYFALLGPSGGGKTTLLRLIGGFIRPTAGQIFLNEKDVTGLAPEHRSTSMVFQSYALFPHMSVTQNVGYGLRLRKRPKDQIAAEVEAMLDLVGLKGYGERRTFELSGGQQQRVQLARALILKSDILLLDEPLAALDAQLRKDMCFELKHLQKKVGITFIHVTHNQDEAMSVANRVALVANGELIEIAGVRDIYDAPKDKFTASFVGERNMLAGVVSSVDAGVVRVDLGHDVIGVPCNSAVLSGERVIVSVRSESMSLAPGGSDRDHEAAEALTATYVESVYLGLVTRHVVRLTNGQEINVRDVGDGKAAPSFTNGDPVSVTWRTCDAILHSS